MNLIPVRTKSVARRRRGFTLIELLVSMAVLVLLVVMIIQMTDSATKTIGVSDKLIDAASQARLVFGSLDEDLSNLVRRPDVPFQGQNVVTDPPTNLLCFISKVASADSSLSSTANRNVSVVAYQVAALTNSNLGPDGQARQCLIRAGKAIPWTGTGSTGFFGLDDKGVPVTFTSPIFPTGQLMPTTPDFDVLSPGVIRLVVGFQLYPDNQPVTLLDNTAIANARGQVVYSAPIRAVTPSGGGATVNVVDVSRISAIVVGLVVIDLNSLRLLNSAQVTALANAFPVPTPTAGSAIPLPVQFWQPTASSTVNLRNAVVPSAIPLPALQSVRVFSHFYPITPYASRL